MIAESILPEFDHEFAQLRRMLEHVPETIPEYAPHQKSMTMQRLVGHLAELPEWTNATIDMDELDFATFDYQPFMPATRAEAIERLDKALAGARACLAGASDETLMGNWTMRDGDKVYMTMPKVAVLRSFVFNHMIHHRAQLGVYLRLNDLHVPGMYGPSADEPM
ncbi:MAG: DinB family protein [Gemmatimonadota bacterium]